MRTSIKALALAAMAALTLGVIGTSPAHAETGACASAMNQQGARCASFTVTTSGWGFQAITADSEKAGAQVGFTPYVTTNPRQDFDTLLTNASGNPSLSGIYTDFQAMPDGVTNGLCLKAASTASGALITLEACSTSPLEQFTVTEHSNGSFTFKVRGSGSPGEALAEVSSTMLTLQPDNGGVDEHVSRTD